MDACESSRLPLIILKPFLIFPKTERERKLKSTGL